MKLRVHATSNVGLVRQRNEDSFLVDLRRDVFAVADGIGGLPGGDVASQTAIAAVRTLLADNDADTLENLPALVASAHAAVLDAGQKFGPNGIGTTLTLAHLAEGVAHIAHVGDSFAFLVRGGRCRALTREHNIENERDNLLTLSAYPPAYRYALTRVVGQVTGVEPEIFEEKLRAGDRLVLATDGLTDLLEAKDVAAICARHVDVAACADELVAAALGRGGHDNITVVVVAVDAV
jgi:protein phosphatase